MKPPETFLIKESNFHNAWARGVQGVQRNGKEIVIGDLKEPKPIKDLCNIFDLAGEALSQRVR